MKISSRESGKIARDYVIEKLKERYYKIIEINNMNLSVESPNGVIFKLKITSLSKPNAWILPIFENGNSYYVLVFKPEDSLPVFFILKPEEMHKEIKNHISSMRRPVNEYSNPELEKKGLSFSQPFPYENQWSSLPK